MGLSEDDMTTPDSELILAGYETVAGSGLSLPLFKTDQFANSWYIANTEYSNNLDRSIISFSLYYPRFENRLNVIQFNTYKIGDKYPIIFTFNDKTIISDVQELNHIFSGDSELQKLFPITAFDLSLYSNTDIVNSGRRCFNEISTLHGVRVATKWCSNTACKQAVMMDFEHINFDERELIGSKYVTELYIIPSFTRRLHFDNVSLIVDDAIKPIISGFFSDLYSYFPKFTTVSEIINCTPRLMSRSEYRRRARTAKLIDEEFIPDGIPTRMHPEIRISGRGFHIKKDEIDFVLNRFLDQDISYMDVNIVVSKDGNLYICSITVRSKYGRKTIKDTSTELELSCSRAADIAGRLFRKLSDKSRP